MRGDVHPVGQPADYARAGRRLRAGLHYLPRPFPAVGGDVPRAYHRDRRPAGEDFSRLRTAAVVKPRRTVRAVPQQGGEVFLRAGDVAETPGGERLELGGGGIQRRPAYLPPVFAIGPQQGVGLFRGEVEHCGGGPEPGHQPRNIKRLIAENPSERGRAHPLFESVFHTAR